MRRRFSGLSHACWRRTGTSRLLFKFTERCADHPLLKDYPKDLVSLKRVQVLCFYSGQPDVLLEIVEQLCHVLQNDCHSNEAVDFMQACSPSWSACSSFMYTHNWWHVAVCYLEGHSSMQNVLEVYDHFIWKELERKGCDCEEVNTKKKKKKNYSSLPAPSTLVIPSEIQVHLNALGLLLGIAVRRQMDFVGDRLKILADIFSNESNWHTEWLGDKLALRALAATEKVNKANELVNSLKFRVSSMSKKRQQIAQQ